MDTVRTLLQRLSGWFDYHLRPHLADRFGPFNNQQFRRQIFEWIVADVRPAYIVETGTARGGTTAFMAERTPVPVFGIEIDTRRITFAGLRLKSRPAVRLLHGDSEALLDSLLRGGDLPSGIGFFYLDAHWGEALPLAAEIEQIFTHRPESIVMIDDFNVPDDPGYGYDDYGPGKTLAIDYVRPVVTKLGLRGFFPACHSTQETGFRRGTLMLARSSADRLAACPLLREWHF
jgi:predicted O-methyltransferase YrrM